MLLLQVDMGIVGEQTLSNCYENYVFYYACVALVIYTWLVENHWSSMELLVGIASCPFSGISLLNAFIYFCFNHTMLSLIISLSY